MKAASLSVNLAGPCNASCPFCISKLTGHGESQKFNMKAMQKAFSYASYHGVDTVLITGKGEPTLKEELTSLVIDRAHKVGFPIIELQTNGYMLWKNPKMLEIFENVGLTTVAISIADFIPRINNKIIGLPEDYNYKEVIEHANELGLLCRISFNMTHPSASNIGGIKAGARMIKAKGAHQLTLRELGIPNEYNKNDSKQIGVVNWIEKNSISSQTLKKIIKEVCNEDRKLRTVSYGPSVYDYCGLSTVVASCMTDNSNPEEIRSLILQPNGHLYHSWNYEGSIIL
jgi:molybdenum cofactor biosynthesis enzyme MoaA